MKFKIIIYIYSNYIDIKDTFYNIYKINIYLQIIKEYKIKDYFLIYLK